MKRHKCSSGDWNGSERRWREWEPRRRPEEHGSRSAGCMQRMARESEAFAKARIGMRKGPKVARMEERTHGRKAAAGKEAKGKRKVAREKQERVGRVARQDTLQLGAGKEATETCTPLMKMTSRMLKSRPTVKRICNRGVCWKK